jgi:hypothetical protein
MEIVLLVSYPFKGEKSPCLSYLLGQREGASLVFSSPTKLKRKKNIIIFISNSFCMGPDKNNCNTTSTREEQQIQTIQIKILLKPKKLFEFMMKNIYSFSSTTFHTCFLAPVPTGNHMVNGHSYNGNFRPKSSFILASPPPYPTPLYWKRYIYREV